MKGKAFDEKTYYKFIAYVLLSFTLVNPVVFYLVVDNLILSLSIFFITLAILIINLFKFKKSWINWWLINCLSVISLFIYSELIFNEKFSDYIIEDLYDLKSGYYFNKPFLNKKIYDKEYVVDYVTNQEGYRVSKHYNKPNNYNVNTVDWLFIGDSFTQGAQVDFHDLFTTDLYRKHPDKIIINSGISGFGIAEELAYYKNEGYKLKPKKVFLQLCSFNDFMNVKERTYGLTDYLMQKSNFIRFLLYGFKYANPKELPLGRWTEPFYDTKEGNLDYNIFYKGESEIKKNDLLKFEKYLKEFSEVTTSQGAELIIFLIPTKEQISKRYLDEVLENFDIDIAELDLKKPNKLMLDLCKKYNIEFIDMYDIFSQVPFFPFYDYDEHLNINGHKLVADIINHHETKSNVSILSKEFIGDRYPTTLNNGNNILYQSIRAGNSEIILADNNLNEVKRITYNDIDEIHPKYNEISNKLVFTEGNQATNKTNVIIMNLDQSERFTITASDSIFGAIPDISMDGKSIVYAEWKKTNKNITNPIIVKYEVESHSKKYLTNGKNESWRPVFSPINKNQIVYISKSKDEFFNLYLYDTKTEEEVKLTDSNFDIWDPSFSPDGTKLVYSGFEKNNWDLFILDLASLKIERVTNTRGNEWDPIFNFSGDTLIYAGEYGIFDGIYFKELEQEPILPQ
ncbi:hypothetical protein [Flammeovirga sp. SubArs3]|uniref:hypothetical protein n=1 Tax=Flammeovirga sp. SubArs3 TaxID=2995316 RepID=UPI00248C70DF|nr:hypothetical protein [Flammeovirga sp. SubArs3]